jgi:pyruvate/2-oxoglutarate/acetoin dehydrogenase E1 component
VPRWVPPMTGMRPVAEIMFSDFIACCYDYSGQRDPQDALHDRRVRSLLPLVIRTANGGGLGFWCQALSGSRELGLHRCRVSRSPHLNAG